jgi:hypothetical protein
LIEAPRRISSLGKADSIFNMIVDDAEKFCVGVPHPVQTPAKGAEGIGLFKYLALVGGAL